METKLTLRLEQETIAKAKLYATERKLSLSKLIENYLNALTSDKTNRSDVDISPFVKSMATGQKIPTDVDYKKDYSDYLTEKYQ